MGALFLRKIRFSASNDVILSQDLFDPLLVNLLPFHFF